MIYKPTYDATIQTVTRTENQATLHRDSIDWSYPFDDLEHVAGMCCDDNRKREELAKLKAWLECLEAKTKTRASTYGGWPRIWHQVIAVGMASCWPYWKPRPTVIVVGTLGAEWWDWTSLTGVED